MTVELEARKQWQPLKHDGRITVYRAQAGRGAAAKPVLVKEYHFRSWLDRLSFWRKRRLLRRFYADPAMAGAEIVPALLSSGWERTRGQFCYAYIAGRDLRALDWARCSPDQLHTVMEQAARLLRRLHAGGWVHGDLKFGNLLISDDQQLFLLDVEDVRASHSARRRARDLARFLLNGLELQVPLSGLGHFWSVYSRDEAKAVLKPKVEEWLTVLARRHASKYGRHTDLQALRDSLEP